jgi:hypothetical protein
MNLARLLILALLAAVLAEAQPAGQAAATPPPTPEPLALNLPRPGDPRPFNVAGLIGVTRLANRSYVIMLDGPIGCALDRLRFLPMAGGMRDAFEIPLANPAVGVYAGEQPFWIPGTDWGCKSVSLSLVKSQAKLTFGAMLKTRRAQCKFGTKPVDMVLLDANESRSLGEPSQVPTGDDGFAIRSRQKKGDVAIINGQAYPLGQPFVGLGSVWKLSVGDDGKVVAERQSVAVGVIAWRGSAPQEVKLTLAGKETLLTSQKPQGDGTWQVPAGEYRIEQCQYGLNGMQVSVDATAKPDAIKVTVAAGKPLVLGPLAEIVAKANPSVQNGAVRFDLSLSSPTGASVKLSGNAKPQLRVLNAAGLEVYRGSFEYG